MISKRHSIIFTLFMLLAVLISACGGAEQEAVQEVIEVEVTRVVTEEVIVEGEVVEVTVVQSESDDTAVEEEMEEAADEEMAEEFEPLEDGGDDDVSAIGSEDATGDVPPPPEDGPKVEGTRNSNAPADSETNPDVRSGGESVPTAVSTSSEDPIDQNSQLTAGEVDDNAQFDNYLAYLSAYEGAAIIPIKVEERHRIIVTDSQDNPVLGATILLYANGELITELRTHSDGSALFFPGMFGLTNMPTYTADLIVNDVSQQVTLEIANLQQSWQFVHPAADQARPSAQLDVLFLIDATGSMSDEITQLKENIQTISAQVNASPTAPDVRFGMVTYRDRGDDYVTNQTAFTSDIEQFSEALAQVEAAGGGDYPEDLNSALNEALNEMAWRVEDTVSLIFLVADAPPHLDYQQEFDYGRSLEHANGLGIKIYPIASSGLDAQGEYVFRQLAQVTNGRFIFLTYAGNRSTAPGTSTEFEVSDYTVSALNELVVRLIEEELEPLNR